MIIFSLGQLHPGISDCDQKPWVDACSELLSGTTLMHVINHKEKFYLETNRSNHQYEFLKSILDTLMPVGFCFI
jgi:hypothetical protein